MYLQTIQIHNYSVNITILINYIIQRLWHDIVWQHMFNLRKRVNNTGFSPSDALKVVVCMLCVYQVINRVAIFRKECFIWGWTLVTGCDIHGHKRYPIFMDRFHECTSNSTSKQYLNTIIDASSTVWHKI